MTFPDHFSGHASDYSQFRPLYPAALYDWLATLAPAEATVWDCATGNGQAAVALAGRFEHVEATDASANQIDSAQPHPRVRYTVKPADDSGLAAGSVGLVTVAQALHWFDHKRFAAEVDRVLVPGGAVVAWCYELFAITPAVDAVVLELYHGLLGADWPPERRYLENGYRDVPWPWARVVPPEVAMTADWSVEQTIGYLRTWSASQRYLKREQVDPVTLVEASLRAAWGAQEVRRVSWPLKIVAGTGAVPR